MTTATFSIVFASAGTASVCSSNAVIAIVLLLLDAAGWLRDAADLGGELCGPLGEELVELLHGHAGLLAERTDGRRRAGLEVALAHEPDHEPVPAGQLVDAGAAGDLLRELLVPLLWIREETLRVDVDGVVGDQCCGHLSSFKPRLRGACLGAAWSGRRAESGGPVAARASRRA